MHPTPTPLRLQTNYNSFYSALGAGALMLGIALAAVLYVGGDREQIAWTVIIIGGIWGLIILVLGLSNRYTVERERRDARALFAGDAWATWRWSVGEWQAVLNVRREELEKRQRIGRFAPLVGGIAAVVIGGTPIVMALAVPDIPAQVREFMIALGVFFAILAIALSVVGTLRERRKWERHYERASRIAAPWVLLGAQGFYHETDGHTSLRNLTDVSLTRDGGMLTFQIRHPGPRGTSYTLPVNLPVPATHREEAKALVKRYREERRLHG